MRSVLVSLLEKYRELHRLRVGDDGGQPVERMREVAARWPGALREIDELPMSALEARITALERAQAGGPTPTWATPVSQFHGLMRACLAVKRHAGRDTDRALAWVQNEYEPDNDEPSRECMAELAARVARPPEGRLSRLVLQEVAAANELSVEACERVMFPPSPRRLSADRSERQDK
ncbi:MAG: hypothetical protein AB8I08_32860 [Sandaracinaceae bacterium]